jgi:hypothetical protein
MVAGVPLLLKFALSVLQCVADFEDGALDRMRRKD